MEKEIYAKYCHPNDGYDTDMDKCREYLKLNHYYKVYDIDIGSFHTDVQLIDENDVIRYNNGAIVNFNSVNFEFYIREGKIIDVYIPYDILSDSELNPYFENEEELNYEDSESKENENLMEEANKSLTKINERDLLGATLIHIDVNNPQYQAQVIVEKEGIIYQLCSNNNGGIILSKIEREVK